VGDVTAGKGISFISLQGRLVQVVLVIKDSPGSAGVCKARLVRVRPRGEG